MPSVQCIELAYNSVYLLRAGSESLLVDTGPDYLGAGEQLVETLGTTQPNLVAATHGHLDHAGLGHWWQERGIEVALHEQDRHFAAGHQLDDEEFAGLTAFAAGSGAPPEIAAEAIAGIEQRRAWSRDAAHRTSYRPAGRDSRWPTGLRYQPFVPGRWLSGRAEALPAGATFLHMPGHTPGNGVIWFGDEGWLFSGDQLLPEITPTPALQAVNDRSSGWRFRSLPEFVRSLRAIRELGAVRCYPGHGAPFDNVLEVVDANLAQVEQRAAKLRSMLRAMPGRPVYDIAEELYPRALRRRFWQIIATVQGHLDLLEDSGEARTEDARWFAC